MSTPDQTLANDQSEAPAAHVVDDRDTTGYWELLDAGGDGLPVQRCGACGARQFPALATCRTCGSGDLKWVAERIDGTVRTWVRVNHPIYGYLEEAVPYTVIFADAGPQCHVLARWAETDAPTDGDRVEITVVPGEAGRMPTAVRKP